MTRFPRLVPARPLRLVLNIDRKTYSIRVSIYEDPRPIPILSLVRLAAVNILYFSTYSL